MRKRAILVFCDFVGIGKSHRRPFLWGIVEAGCYRHSLWGRYRGGLVFAKRQKVGDRAGVQRVTNGKDMNKLLGAGWSDLCRGIVSSGINNRPYVLLFDSQILQ